MFCIMGAGLNSSAYDVAVTLETPTIAIDDKILTDDITITDDFLNGDSGLLRLWFSFTTGADYQVTVTKLGEADLTGSPLILNADNTFIMLSDGYYRFDIGVQPGDLINLSSSVAISAINDFQIQRVQIAT